MCFIPFTYVRQIFIFSSVLLILEGLAMFVLGGLAAANPFFHYTNLSAPLLGVSITIGIILIAFSLLVINGIKTYRAPRICLGLIFIFFSQLGVISLIVVSFASLENYSPRFNP